MNDDSTPLPAIFGSPEHRDQVVAVEVEHDHVQLSLTPEAAVELARIVVQYGSAIRLGQIPAPSSARHDQQLWRDVGLALNVGVLQATASGSPTASRYVAPRPPEAVGRRRREHAPLTVVRTGQ